MILTGLAAVSLVLAAAPALLFLRNLARFRPPPSPTPGLPARRVSVIVPARDEEANIGRILDELLASRGVELEIAVVDDGSTDATPGLVLERAARDPRVRLVEAPTLPAGWNGKMFACHTGARTSAGPALVFLDADLSVHPDALARLLAGLDASGAGLVSGVPHQRTGSWLEDLIVPLIPFVLLGFLPLGRMRQSAHPAYAAGVGQVFAARRWAYDRAGGHAAIRHTRHDGLALPRAFRRAGIATDLLDLSGLLSVRMYRDARQTVAGFAKNADEGLGRPPVLASLGSLLLLGQVLPFLLLALGPWLRWQAALLAALAVALVWLPRVVARRRFGQPWRSVLGHPAGVLLLLATQVYGLVRARSGRRVAWRGRSEPVLDGVSARAA